jgi:hypothetical protein
MFDEVYRCRLLISRYDEPYDNFHIDFHNDFHNNFLYNVYETFIFAFKINFCNIPGNYFML